MRLRAAIGRLFAPLPHISLALAVAGLLLVSPVSVRTQSIADRAVEVQSDDVPAHIAVVDGTATLERSGRVDAALENVPLVAGDRIKTDRGRVEVLFGDGSALDLDEYSSIDLQSESLTRLLAGRMRLLITRVSRDAPYRVDAPAGSIRILAPGEYRFSLSDSRSSEVSINVAVLRGTAELANDAGRTMIYAGSYAIATTGYAPSIAYAFNSAQWDSFDRWAEEQRNARLGAVSARYLPPDLQSYGGSFDQYGYWGYEPTYGYVWYPRVATSWRPYYDGRWTYMNPYGWTWVGFERWSWPTHHYGRWGVSVNRWFWVPDRRWGPAWVTWAYSPTYVSWCPLGFDGRPVVAWGRGYWIDPWNAWTFVPARNFVPNVIVTRNVVQPSTVVQTSRSQFVAGNMGPPLRATPSNGQPLRSPRGDKVYAVPRGSAVSEEISSKGGTRVTGSPVEDPRVDPRQFSRSGGGLNDPPASRTEPQTQPWNGSPVRVVPAPGSRQRPAEPDHETFSAPRAVPRNEPRNEPPPTPPPAQYRSPSPPPEQYRHEPDRFGTSNHASPPPPPQHAEPRTPPPSAQPQPHENGRSTPPPPNSQGSSDQNRTSKGRGGK